MSHAAFDRISPAFPQRAPWGTSARLRAWQAEAVQLYRDRQPRDFLAVATPGAGKTTFALRIAAELLNAKTVGRVIVVVPTEHLKTQWADAAAKVGIQLDPSGTGSRRGRSREFDGVAVTYAGVSVRAWHYEAVTLATPTLVIFDEIHHAGDARSWGDSIKDAFGQATRRLALTGTPFRSDETPIPFVGYDEQPDGSLISHADFVYGYAEALRDHVVRPVVFMNYGGPMRWRTTSGDEIAANLGEVMTKDLTAQAWRTALDPKGEWIGSVLRAADRRLSEVRRHLPDAGGLVIAANQRTARAYSSVLEQISGAKPALVLSDDASSSAKIEQFANDQSRWMVAVRMVSEGVDVPRLAVGVYATSTSTPLFFAQAVGRFVRARRRGELATIFLPTVPIILAHAASIERQRDHVLGRPKHPEAVDIWAETEALMAKENAQQRAADDLLNEYEAVSSEAIFDHVLFDSQAYGMTAAPTTDDEADYLGLPGLLESDQVAHLLEERQRRQVARHERTMRKEKVPAEQALHRQLADKRKELNSLVAQYARLKGTPHSHVHANLRRECGGPPLGQATSAQVDARLRTIKRWLGR
ncbi:DEAD/DEAH box helicase [Brooklawnia sp.]|uniref:DEAD/DEAH box helicase n=1 Tax=Brooklawnia sp. TaxID=2699740 RepID=UPI00311F359C